MNYFTPFLPLNEIAIHTLQERRLSGDIETQVLECARMRREQQEALEAIALFTIPFLLIIAAAAQVTP
ncbi:hypothetical protein FHX08_002045 [Rhizobium sp. BK529]|uniref:hypothetical protein n=1 Tax=Rhizobium sp. BK529 TaxID=2586983 RepID=UPI00160D845E|nr:hypothetical protein [Rhizobium sp. BK529]MBB3591701.1 hypothetical protein [Rhizobium sp. BK529]